jgi:hypothetical protein
MDFKHTIMTNGTCLQGYVRTTFDKIIHAFGAPNIGSSDKTNSEWALRFSDGTVATIYDYKEPHTPVKEYDWQIGGHDNRAVQRVCAVLGTLPVKYV